MCWFHANATENRIYVYIVLPDMTDIVLPDMTGIVLPDMTRIVEYETVPHWKNSQLVAMPARGLDKGVISEHTLPRRVEWNCPEEYFISEIIVLSRITCDIA